MYKYILIFILPVFFVGIVNAACYTDYDCGYGNKCVKSSGDYNVTGVCVSGSNTYGVTPPGYNMGSNPTIVKSCSFDTDCTYGYSCMKRSGQLTGICVK